MNSATRRNPELARGAMKIADTIRTQLVQRGCRHEEISLNWDPDPDLARRRVTTELRATLADCGSVHQLFSRDELRVSCERVSTPSVAAKVDLIVASLSAGLP